MDEHGVVGEGEMEAVVTGSAGTPKHTNAMVPQGGGFRESVQVRALNSVQGWGPKRLLPPAHRSRKRGKTQLTAYRGSVFRRLGHHEDVHRRRMGRPR